MLTILCAGATSIDAIALTTSFYIRQKFSFLEGIRWALAVGFSHYVIPLSVIAGTQYFLDVSRLVIIVLAIASSLFLAHLALKSFWIDSTFMSESRKRFIRRYSPPPLSMYLREYVEASNVVDCLPKTLVSMKYALAVTAVSVDIAAASWIIVGANTLGNYSHVNYQALQVGMTVTAIMVLTAIALVVKSGRSKVSDNVVVLKLDSLFSRGIGLKLKEALPILVFLAISIKSMWLAVSMAGS